MSVLAGTGGDDAVLDILDGVEDGVDGDDEYDFFVVGG